MYASSEKQGIIWRIHKLGFAEQIYINQPRKEEFIYTFSKNNMCSNTTAHIYTNNPMIFLLRTLHTKYVPPDADSDPLVYIPISFSAFVLLLPGQTYTVLIQYVILNQEKQRRIPLFKLHTKRMSINARTSTTKTIIR